MSKAPVLVERRGKHFPVSIFVWKENKTYIGEEVDHLWLAGTAGVEGHGNSVIVWRGPMDVKLENVRDHAERLGWGQGVRIAGPDLIHIIAEFPQLGGDLRAMYLLQAILADELSSKLVETGCQPRVVGTDIFVGAGKLNVGVCAATPTSCTMHFGVNVTLEGEPSIPHGVNAFGLGSALDQEEGAIEFMLEVVRAWVDRTENLQLKVYKTA